MTEEVAVANATAEVAPDVKATFKSFDEMVTYFKEKIEAIQQNTLVICWEIGYEANLIKKAAVYGAKTVENFVSSLDMPGMDIKRVYRYAQFADEYNRTQLDSVMAKKHVGWGAINKLISVKDIEDRTDFEDRLNKGEIKPSELDDEISLYMSKLEADSGETETTSGTGSGGRRSYLKHFKKGAIAVEILKNVIPLALKDLTDLDDIADKEDQYNKVLDAIYEFREKLEEIQSMLDEFIEAAGKVA